MTFSIPNFYNLNLWPPTFLSHAGKTDADYCCLTMKQQRINYKIVFKMYNNQIIIFKLISISRNEFLLTHPTFYNNFKINFYKNVKHQGYRKYQKYLKFNHVKYILKLVYRCFLLNVMLSAFT